MSEEQKKMIVQGYYIEIAKTLNNLEIETAKELKEKLLKVIEILDKIIEIEG